MKRISGIFLVFIISVTLYGQYVEEWTMTQDSNEWGHLYFDINEDGVPEITKQRWNTVTLYDGANNYDVAWYIYDEDYEYLSLHEIYDFGNNGQKEAVFIAYNLYSEYLSKISVYSVMDTTPEWSSQEYNGLVSSLYADDVDGDDEKEIVFGINQYNIQDSSYTAFIHVLDGLTGDEEWSSSPLSGYMIGPFLGDLDGDGTVEIMINLYDYSNEDYQLIVWGFSGASVVHRTPQPDFFRMGENYPNPFNSINIIPIEVRVESQVRVSILDTNGREIINIFQGKLLPGKHQLFWDGRNAQGLTVSSGIYFYQVETGTNLYSQPMVLVK